MLATLRHDGQVSRVVAADTAIEAMMPGPSLQVMARASFFRGGSSEAGQRHSSCRTVMSSLAQ
jgi:hypothetical protein